MLFMSLYAMLCIHINTGLELEMTCPIQLFIYQDIYGNGSDEIIYLMPVAHFSNIM